MGRRANNMKSMRPHPEKAPELRFTSAAEQIEEINLKRVQGTCIGAQAAQLVNIFNPEKIILSGGISSSASLYLEKVKKVANEHTILSMMNSFEIVQSSLKENAAIYGAASIVFDRKQPHTSEVQ